MKSSIRTGVVTLAAFVSATASLQAGTIAFYPFTEGEPGTSALDTTLANAVDEAKFGGISTATYNGLSGVRFSEDVPGAYLFDGSGFKESTYVGSFGSIDVWGRTNSSGGALNGTSSATVAFDGLAEALSTYGSWTIEFFHKPAVAEFLAGGSSRLVAFDAGLSVRGESGTLSIYFPTAAGDGFRGMVAENANPGGTPLFYLQSALGDMRGSWNHFALTYDGSTGTMKLYHNYVHKSTDTFVAGTAPEGAALSFANGGVRGKYCAFRVSDRVLAASEMLHASDNPTQLDRLVWDLPLEGVAGEAVASDNAAVANGVEPRYVTRRPMRIVENGVVTGVTSNAVQLTVTPKSSSSQVFATGPGLKVLKSSVADALDESFTMEGYFKFDNASWEQKVSGLVIDGVAESRKRMTIMGQQWSSTGRNQLWVFAFDKTSAGYRPRIDCVCNISGTLTAVTRTGTTLLATDGKFHRYVVTYSQPTCTFVCYEDDNEVFRTELPGDLSFANQGDWLVGTQLGNHPFEGEVDSVRLSRGVLPRSAFRTMERIPVGVLITFL